MLESRRDRIERQLRERGIALRDLVARSHLDQWGSAPVRVGVSGGPDSMGLVILAWANGQRVHGIHVDHGLRPDSCHEGAMIADALAPFGVGLTEYRILVDDGGNLEDRARQARLARLQGAATAHTMDDQAETVLANLVRGAGLIGLGAMQPGPRHPILGLRRSEMRAICEVAGVWVLDDPSNQDPRFVRNRVRAELIPLANAIVQRDVVPILARTAGQSRDYAQALDEVLGQHPNDPSGMPPVLARHRLNAQIVAGLGLRLTSAQLERVRQVAIGACRGHQIVGAITVRRERGRLVFVSAEGVTLLGLDLT